VVSPGWVAGFIARSPHPRSADLRAIHLLNDGAPPDQRVNHKRVARVVAEHGITDYVGDITYLPLADGANLHRPRQGRPHGPGSVPQGHLRLLKDTYVGRGELHPDTTVFLDAALR